MGVIELRRFLQRTKLVGPLASDWEAVMRLWHWIVGIFFRRAPETEIYGREAVRKVGLDETAREIARLHAIGLPHSGLSRCPRNGIRAAPSNCRTGFRLMSRRRLCVAAW